MQRRSFLKASGAIALGAGLASDSAAGLLSRIGCMKVRFSTDDYPSWSVVMALRASRDVVPNYLAPMFL